MIDDVISHDDDDVINYVRPADTGKSIVTTDIRRAGWVADAAGGRAGPGGTGRCRRPNGAEPTTTTTAVVGDRRAVAASSRVGSSRVVAVFLPTVDNDVASRRSKSRRRCHEIAR